LDDTNRGKGKQPNPGSNSPGSNSPGSNSPGSNFNDRIA